MICVKITCTLHVNPTAYSLPSYIPIPSGTDFVDGARTWTCPSGSQPLADFVDGARTWTCPSGSQPLHDFVDGVCVCLFLLAASL